VGGRGGGSGGGVVGGFRLEAGESDGLKGAHRRGRRCYGEHRR
jgi:hypothetical protein